MNGKNRCRILKDIRRRIAEENGIEYVTSECKYKGDCAGTCPKCESEVRYLERELERRRSLGYKVTVAGLVAGITLTSAGCSLFEESVVLKGDMPNSEAISQTEECTATAGELLIEDSSCDSSDESSCDSSDESSLPDEVELLGEFPEEILQGDIEASDYE